MILIDTSAWIALADTADLHHREAKRLLGRLRASATPTCTHSYVVLETAALMHRRLGRKMAEDFLGAVLDGEIIWIDERLHRAALARYLKARSTGVSLVDSASFAIMDERPITAAFTFDSDFAKEGYHIYL